MSDLTWPQILTIACLAVFAATMLITAIRDRRSLWRRINRRKPGVLGAPSEKCNRSLDVGWWT